MAEDTPREHPITRKTSCPPSEKDILKGTADAWVQYKKGTGTRVNSSEELNSFLDNL